MCDVHMWVSACVCGGVRMWVMLVSMCDAYVGYVWVMWVMGCG